MKLTYLLINLASVAMPFLFSFERSVRFVSWWKYLFPAMFITSIPFLVWDHFFALEGVWGFNEAFITGNYLGALPIEEVLFFFAIPYASIFIYAAINQYFPKNLWFNKHHPIFSWTFFVLAVIAAVVYADRWYTVVNATYAAIWLGLQLFFIRGAYMGNFWRFYWIHLIPFAIVNGMLTGTGLEEPVVWYNNNENMGIRLGTIPAEDAFYSLSLMLMNITLIEFFKRRNFTTNGNLT